MQDCFKLRFGVRRGEEEEKRKRRKVTGKEMSKLKTEEKGGWKNYSKKTEGRGEAE